jgi:hypothetical protein
MATVDPAVRVPDEPANEHVRNAMQLLHNLRSYEMSSAELLRHDETLNAIDARLRAAVKKLEGR